ncbi:MAG: Crp/Fnr family transcriptional regulator [Pseudomonadota bacterium]
MTKTTPAAPRHAPEWISQFPALAGVGDPTWMGIARRARELVIPAGTEIFREGGDWKQFLFVTAGTLRIYKAFENGRELVLYRVNSGEVCCLTATVLLGGGLYTANGIAEVETRVAALAVRDFRDAFNRSEGFRNFICTSLGRRFEDLVALLEAVTMRHIDVRLARWLINRRDAGGRIDASHRELARELGTAREVISRHLKDFESRGWVGLGRKHIEIIDPASLQALALG